MKQCVICSYTSKKAYDSDRREDLHTILIWFIIPMRMVRLIKMCLTERIAESV
jgi:hypothetical protein